ncbi:hypothetical protein NDU88_004862 [Pleurodeles waltl]|uniref:Uncharacterized protein n=1 Tax=Pleurodeles waltl TaxID=8319 RepID=A0AAV7QDQ1_PLEWA|nr:hypothetical protein NDU88_004862 [Pleurodeles waltl]
MVTSWLRRTWRPVQQQAARARSVWGTRLTGRKIKCADSPCVARHEVGVSSTGPLGGSEPPWGCGGGAEQLYMFLTRGEGGNVSTVTTTITGGFFEADGEGGLVVTGGFASRYGELQQDMREARKTLQVLLAPHGKERGGQRKVSSLHKCKEKSSSTEVCAAKDESRKLIGPGRRSSDSLESSTAEGFLLVQDQLKA